MEKKIRSTIIVGIVLAILIALTVYLVKYDVTVLIPKINSRPENATTNFDTADKFFSLLLYGFFTPDVDRLISISASIVSTGSLFTLIFAIVNRKSCIKSIKTINGIFAILCVLLMIYTNVHLVLFMLSAGLF